MQPAVPRKKRSLGDYITWLLIGLGLVLVLSLGGWATIVLMGKTSSDTGKTQAGMAALLEPASTAPSIRTINSELGVQIPYNMRELEGFGFADDVTFSSSDLDEPRAYTVMRVRPVETSEATRSNVSLESPELRVTSSINKGYWDSLSAKNEYKDLSKIDMLVKETVASRKHDKSVEATDTEVKNVGNIDYRKVTFTTKNERYGVPTERREDCYMTVQNDRPYVACINGIRSANFAVLPQLEQVVSAMSYDDLDEKVLVSSAEGDAAKNEAKAKDGAMLDSTADAKVAASKDKEAAVEANKSDEVDQSKNTPKISPYLVDAVNFKAMASAAPATVRVGTVYCSDIKLTLPTTDGDGPTLTGACSEKAGTGFFVSRSGLVATSASSVQVKPQEAITAYITDAPSSDQAMQRLQRVLDYMVEGRIIMQTDADAIVAGVEERDQEAIAKVNELSYRIAVEDIAVTKESYKYAVQLADKPIVVNRQGDGSATFAYTDTVLEASVDGSVYTAGKTQQEIYEGGSIASDTALLSVKKSANYPVLTLARSGESVADKSTVNIVGMPMYAVGSLESAQFRGTPLYRGGNVAQTFTADAGQKVRMITTSSHAGFAGAPVVDQQSRVIGMATYGNLNCQDRKCFAGTVIRDISGITEIAKQRNISLQTTSPASEAWNNGVSQLVDGNYREATSLFDSAARLYPQSQFAAQFAAYSKSQYGSATDTSTMNSVVNVLQILSIVTFSLLLLATVIKLALKMFMRPHIETQYGHMAQGEYIDPSQWQHQSVGETSAQPAYSPISELPQPVQWQQGSSAVPRAENAMQQPIVLPQSSAPQQNLNQAPALSPPASADPAMVQNISPQQYPPEQPPR